MDKSPLHWHLAAAHISGTLIKSLPYIVEVFSIPMASVTHANVAFPLRSSTVRIEPPRGLFELRFGEVWAYRELLYFFVWRDVKIRYKQTVIGVAWVVLQPLLRMGVFTIFFGRLAKLPSDGLPYPVFYFSALVPWTYFASALQNATNVVVENQRVITLARSLGAPRTLFRRAKNETFWALKDVSLEVHEAEVLGLIGRNGAGKTTLPKILSRITRPTTRWAGIHGRVGSLLEVGTGFDPELTGRENTFLSGAILGMGPGAGGSISQASFPSHRNLESWI
jgi:hypothetical protein